jgi:threonine dehydratase
MHCQIDHRPVPHGGTRELTLAHLRAYLDGIVTVCEAKILTTVAQLARSAWLVAEPSGAVAPAAWLHRRDE